MPETTPTPGTPVAPWAAGRAAAKVSGHSLDCPCLRCVDFRGGYRAGHTQAAEEAERLRARIHEAVDECNRRHAEYVSRCAQFDKWSAWARQRFDEAGSAYWDMTSAADRLVIMSIIAERDAAEQRGRTQAAADIRAVALQRCTAARVIAGVQDPGIGDMEWAARVAEGIDHG